MRKSAARPRTRYAAFLRGVNIGGHKPVSMQALKTAFEELGFDQVRTVLGSGNVLFHAPAAGSAELTARIEGKLREAFRTDIPVMVRTVAHLRALADADPFRGVELTPQTRLLVTFLAGKPNLAVRVPYEPEGLDFRILRVTRGEVLTALTLSPEGGTPALVQFMDKRLGRALTTRTWNTVLRMLRP